MKKWPWISGLALAVAAGGAWLFATADSRAADSHLQTLTAYQVVKRHEPEVYSRLLDQYVAARAGRITPARFASLANAAISEAATRRLGTAAPAAQLALMRDMTANLAALRARHDDSCFRYLYPEITGGADLAGAIEPEAQARTLELAAEVIRTSAETPSAPASPDEAARKLAPIIDAVYARFGADTQLMSRVREPGIDRVKVCDIALALYERILALPPADASLVFSAVAGPGA